MMKSNILMFKIKYLFSIVIYFYICSIYTYVYLHLVIVEHFYLCSLHRNTNIHFFLFLNAILKTCIILGLPTMNFDCVLC